MPETWANSVDLHLDLSGTRVRAGLETALRDAIRDGRLAAGTRLPSSRALAADLGVPLLGKVPLVNAVRQGADEGRPIVAVEPESETARLVAEVGCGIIVPPGRVDLVAGAIRELRAGDHDLEEMGRRGLDYVRSEGNRDIAVGRYRDLLVSVAGRA